MIFVDDTGKIDGFDHLLTRFSQVAFFPSFILGDNLNLESMKEIWKDIPGYEGYYQVSNLGNIKSLDRVIDRNGGRPLPLKSKPIKIRLDKNGYRITGLRKEGRSTTGRIGRLVGMAFIPNPENKPEINHIDGVKTNDCIDNLEWVTSHENHIHALNLGLYDSHKNKKGLKHHRCKITESEILTFRYMMMCGGCNG